MYEQLAMYYEDSGISAIRFNCKNEEICRGDNSPSFETAREAYVGTEYENHTLPRILFISLDPGRLDSDDPKTIDSQREDAKRYNQGELPKNTHWYHTHDMALTFLSKYKPDLDINDVFQYLAHTNSAKCSQNKEDKKQADGRLFDYCQEYLAKEISILDPDIIVTQGQRACWSVQTIYDRLITLTEIADDPACNYGSININGRDVIWFHCYHPRYGKYWTQRSACHEFWAEIAYHHLEQYGWG